MIKIERLLFFWPWLKTTLPDVLVKSNLKCSLRINKAKALSHLKNVKVYWFRVQLPWFVNKVVMLRVYSPISWDFYWQNLANIEPYTLWSKWTPTIQTTARLFFSSTWDFLFVYTQDGHPELVFSFISFHFFSFEFLVKFPFIWYVALYVLNNHYWK